MRPYFALLSVRLKSGLQYRSAAFAGFMTQLFWGFIRVMVMSAFFASTAQAQPFSLQQTVSYIWLGQAFLGLLPWRADEDMQELVTKGTVAYELLRPLDTYFLWFCRALGWRASVTALRSLPMFLTVAGLLSLLGAGKWALLFPASPLQLLAFLPAILLALLLSGSLTSVINISLIWTLSGRGVGRILPVLTMVLSGMIVPLPFFPEWARRLLALLPFRGLVDAPFRIFLGHIPLAGCGWVYLHQAVWISLLMLLGHGLVRRATRRMVVQGG